MFEKDKVIIVSHVQQMKPDTIASRYTLGLYKYYKDKSLRHVLQHYLDVAESRYGDDHDMIESVDYDEESKRFSIRYKLGSFSANDTYIMAETRDLNCVSALPIAPFEPRSEAEARKRSLHEESGW